MYLERWNHKLFSLLVCSNCFWIHLVKLFRLKWVFQVNLKIGQNRKNWAKLDHVMFLGQGVKFSWHFHDFWPYRPQVRCKWNKIWFLINFWGLFRCSSSKTMHFFCKTDFSIQNVHLFFSVSKNDTSGIVWNAFWQISVAIRALFEEQTTTHNFEKALQGFRPS